MRSAIVLNSFLFEILSQPICKQYDNRSKKISGIVIVEIKKCEPSIMFRLLSVPSTDLCICSGLEEVISTQLNSTQLIITLGALTMR